MPSNENKLLTALAPKSRKTIRHHQTKIDPELLLVPFSYDMGSIDTDSRQASILESEQLQCFPSACRPEFETNAEMILNH